MQRKVLVGVDIGGTNITTGLIIDGQLSQTYEVPTCATKSEGEVLEILYQAIQDVFTDEVSGIGVGVPGIVDSEKGIIYSLSNIPAWKEVHIKQLLEEKFGVSVYVGNDANCFALGVKHFGIGKAYSNIVAVTLGTGLGAGIIINDKIYTGLEGGAGEYGLIPYLDANLEEYCSGKFFRNIKNVEGKEVYLKAKSKDPQSLQLWSELGVHIGQLVNIILYTYSPDLIVLGGSVAKGFEFFIDSVNKQLNSNILKKLTSKVIVDKAVHDNEAVLGAGALCM